MIGSMSAQIVVARPVGSARNAKLKGLSRLTVKTRLSQRNPKYQLLELIKLGSRDLTVL
jgi:hypothetical protein